MRIALISLSQAWEDKPQNFATCRSFLDRAKDERAELAVFPEMTLTGFSMNTSLTAEDRNNSWTVNGFQQLAREYRLAVIFGVAFRDGAKAMNNAVVVDSNGDVCATYSKIHPFSFSGEEVYFNAGDSLAQCDIGGVKYGLTICYDLRFPELYAALGKSCEVIVNIANWPVKRVSHWAALLKARAIENQVYIVGVNRIGSDGVGLVYAKSSQIVSPNGDLLESLLAEEQFDLLELNPADGAEFRRAFSTTQDRRTGLYRKLL
jgi:predicted amidohydrolase